MSSTIDQKSYLKKYLKGPSGDKKKKKKKVIKGKGLKIIDDDVDLSSLRPLETDELDVLNEGEDAPIVAGIIDERPEEVRKMEQYNSSSKWRVIAKDDGFNSKLHIQEIKKDKKLVEKENEIIFGKMYSDSEDDKKNDSDASPPRKQSRPAAARKTVDKRAQNNSDSDFSPPRRNTRDPPPKNRSDKKYDSDLSPPRQREKQKPKERVKKPSRWADAEESTSHNQAEAFTSKSTHRSHSPRSKKDYHLSKNETTRRHAGDESSPQKSRKDNDYDLSPKRKSKKESKKRSKSSDSDASPPRKRQSSPKQRRDKKEKRTHCRNDDRPKNRNGSKYTETKRNTSSDSDMSPLRKSSLRKQKSPPLQKSKSPSQKHDSDSDLSPPRQDRSKSSKHADRFKRRSDSPPPTNKKMARTLEGKLAGLQDARQLREENEAFRRREHEAFGKLGDNVSGRHAQAVSRKAKRETPEDRQKLREKEERQKELDEKYKKWSRGVKQTEAQDARAADYMHEAAKPLARHRNDADLESRLKEVEREGDPMLAFIKDSKRARGDLPPEKPTYKGNFPPNRFNIRPGYRWDGVDRSNGYENKYFQQRSKRKAQEEEAYKWSTEDL